jgi:flagellin
MGFTSVGGNSEAVGTGLSVTSVANANNTIDRIDDALDKISGGRANLGAIQNRLSSTISNLSNVSQNISAANSRIRDADFATETSALSKSQVLQQAGTAMLSQANASTQSVLSLLG